MFAKVRIYEKSKIKRKANCFEIKVLHLRKQTTILFIVYLFVCLWLD